MAKTVITKKLVIGTILITIAVAIFAAALAIAIGVSLGLGLNKEDSSLSSNATTCDADKATCGCPSIRPSISTRIVNATAAIPNSWPWMVAIYVSNGKLCGGTLITYQHVLTAAHCVFDVSSSDLIVYSGIKKLSERANDGVRNVSTISVHPSYNDTLKINDLAVIKLSAPLKASVTVGLCCLATQSSTPEVGSTAVLIGWGRTSPSSNFSDTLQQATVEIVNPSLCDYTSVTDHQVCTGNTTSVACYGDSGSPLMTQINGLWTCMGVVNLGLLTCDSYVVYTRVSHYSLFIVQAISS